MSGLKNVSIQENIMGFFGDTRYPSNIVDTIGQPGGGLQFIQLSNLNIYTNDLYTLQLDTLTHQYPGYWEIGLNTAPGNGSFPDDSVIGYLDIGIWVDGVKEIGGHDFVERLVIPANSTVEFIVNGNSLPASSAAICLFTGYCYKLGF